MLNMDTKIKNGIKLVWAWGILMLLFGIAVYAYVKY